MGHQNEMTTRRRIRDRRALACTTLCAALSPLASAGSVSLPVASEFESSMRMLTDIAMSTTHGPTSGEGVGLLRYDTGLYPPATIDLDLPELRSSSPIDALRWSNRWREIIESVYGGDREMVNYWEQGAAAQGDPMFSVLNSDPSALLSEGPRRSTLASARIEGPGGRGYTRAISIAQGASISGGGGGGQPLPAISNALMPDDSTIPEPIVDPVVLPPVTPTAPAPVEPEPEAPTTPVDPPRLVFNFDGIEWVNPNFNQNPPPPYSDDDDDDGPFDNGPLGGSTAPLAIPTPSAVGLGAAGLLAIGACSRRRKLS